MGKFKPLTLATQSENAAQPISLIASTDPDEKITQLPPLPSIGRQQTPTLMMQRPRSMSVVEQSRGINQAMSMLRLSSLPAPVGAINELDNDGSQTSRLAPGTLPSFRPRSKSVSAPTAFATTSPPTAYAAVLPQLLMTQRSSMSTTMTLLSPIKEQH